MAAVTCKTEPKQREDDTNMYSSAAFPKSMYMNIHAIC